MINFNMFMCVKVIMRGIKVKLIIFIIVFS